MSKSIYVLMIIGIIIPIYSQNLWKKYKVKSEEFSQIERVYIDNRYIQTYRGRTGRWIHTWQGQSMDKMIKEYGITREDIIQINGCRNLRQKHFFNGKYFIPFSEKYLNTLKEAGINRYYRDIPHGEFIWPMVGSRITQKWGVKTPFGTIHSGVDLAAPIGTTVVAAGDGVVIHSGPEGSFGNTVVIMHRDHLVTRYAHLSQTIIGKGEKVQRGQIIALSGNSGISTGAHLHFEIRQNDITLNPENFLSEFKETMDEYVHFQHDQREIIRGYEG